MKKWILCLLLGLLVFTSCGETSKSNTHKNSNSQTTSTKNSSTLSTKTTISSGTKTTDQTTTTKEETIEESFVEALKNYSYLVGSGYDFTITQFQKEKVYSTSITTLRIYHDSSSATKVIENKYLPHFGEEENSEIITYSLVDGKAYKDSNKESITLEEFYQNPLAAFDFSFTNISLKEENGKYQTMVSLEGSSVKGYAIKDKVALEITETTSFMLLSFVAKFETSLCSYKIEFTPYY